jgi:hypothetical protein
MKTIAHLFFGLAPFFFFSGLHAASVKVVAGDDGTQHVVMENNLIHLEIDPDHGARVADLQYKTWSATKIIHDMKEQGLLADHFWQETWPGQFWDAKYDVKIVQQGPDEVSVTFSHLTADPSIPQLLGILLEKTITLKENERKVDVAIRLTNTTSVGKYVGYWMQNVCWLGGDLHGDRYFRPTKRGISQDTSDNQSPVDGGFIRDPQAGWMAAIDAKTQDGLVFFMDYNYLWFMYNCTPANTIEWQDDAVALPAGKSWDTAISVVPTSKLDAVSFASKHLLASVTFKEDPAKNQLEVAQNYVATDLALPSVEVQAELETLLTHQKSPGASAQLSNLGLDPQSVTLDLPYDTKKREPAVIRLTWKGTTAGGEAFTEKTELWYPGTFISNTNPTDGSPLYSIPSAPREKVVIKPDKIERIVQAQPHVLFLQGLMAPSYHLEQAIQKVSPGAEIKNGYAYNGGVFGWGIDFFPYDYSALMSYDLVVIGDVNTASLGETGIEMLKDYCRAGGNLLVLAGPCAYGDGGYQASGLQEILPVSSGAAFDLRAVEKGSAMTSTFPAGLLSASDAAALRPAYLNQVKAKPGAQVLLACGSWPMLTFGHYGSGTICCVTAPPMGKNIFCDQPSWQKVQEYLFPKLGLKR